MRRRHRKVMGRRRCSSMCRYPARTPTIRRLTPVLLCLFHNHPADHRAWCLSTGSLTPSRFDPIQDFMHVSHRREPFSAPHRGQATRPKPGAAIDRESGPIGDQDYSSVDRNRAANDGSQQRFCRDHLNREYALRADKKLNRQGVPCIRWLCTTSRAYVHWTVR